MKAKQYATKQPIGHWRDQKGKKEIPGEKWKWKHNDPKSMGCNKSNSKREVCYSRSLPQEIRKISNNLPLHLQELEKEQTKHKVSRRKVIIKMKA